MTRSHWLPSALVLSVVVGAAPGLAGFRQDDNAGTFIVDFTSNLLGVEESAGVAHDSRAGTMTLAGATGRVLTVPIAPTSFSAWGELRLTATANARADLRVTLRDCDSGAAIDGFDTVVPVVGRVDLSGLDASTVDCLQVEVLLSDTDGIVPILDDVEVTWVAQPVLRTTMGSNTSVNAGENAIYKVGVANSFVDANGVVAFVPLPDATRGIENTAVCARPFPPFGSFPCPQNQDFAPTLLSASDGGAFTATAIVVEGVSVPAGSVFWRLGRMPAGRTRAVTFTLAYDNGLQNGVRYTMQAGVGAVGAAASSDGASRTTLSSSPAPNQRTTLTGTIVVDGQHFVFDGGRFAPVVAYQTTLENAAGTARETIFNPIVEAQLASVSDFLVGSCGVALGDVAGLIDGPPGSSFNAATGLLTMPIDDVGPGSTATASFTVDYQACIDADVIGAISTLIEGKADNSFTQSAATVFFGFEASASGSVALGERLRGSLAERGGLDDLADRTLSHGETGATTMQVVNTGPLRFDDVVAAQQIPAGMVFVGADVPAASGAVLFYATSPDFPDRATPPPLDGDAGPADIDVAGGAFWRPLASEPPSAGETVTWVAAWVPCLQSSLFPSPAGSSCADGPRSVRVEVQLRAKPPDENGYAGTTSCDAFDRIVRGVVTVHGISTSIDNDDASMDASGTLALADEELLHLAPPLARLDNNGTRVSGPGLVRAGGIGEWQITVENDGVDTAQSTTVDVAVPSPLLAGVATPLSVTSLQTDGSVDWSTLPERVRVTLGALPPGASRTIRLAMQVPDGVLNATALPVVPVINAVDDEACADLAAARTFTSFVESTPQLQIRGRVTEGLVASGGDLHYATTVSSVGNGPATRSWAVERVPAQTAVVEAYTAGVDDVGNAFDCDGCAVFFAAQTPSLPSDVSPTFPFSALAQFQQGIETSPGVWVAPAGLADTAAWVAWRLDDPALEPAQLPVGAARVVGLRVRDRGSRSGALIVETTATLSAELPAAVSNAMTTAVLAEPGLNVEVTSTPTVVSAGQPFQLQTSYFNDSSVADTSVTITQTLPVGTSLVSLTHAWNDYTLGNDPGLPAGPVVLGGGDVVQTTNLDGSTTVTVTVCAPDGGGIRGDDLALAEGGALVWTVQVNAGVTSGTVLTTTAVGCYENASSSFCLTAESAVEVANAELSLVKLVDVSAPLPGDELHYTLVLRNVGRVAARDVVIADTLPPGVCLVPGSTRVATPGWRLPEPRVAGGPCASTSTQLTFAGLFNPAFPPAGTVPPRSQDILISYTAVVDAAVAPGTTLTNGAVASTSTAEDGAADNDAAVDIRTPFPDPFVSLGGDAVVLPGGAGAWTITYGNATRPTATDVVLILDVPDADGDGIVDVTVTGGAGLAGETLVCHRGPPGSRPALDITDAAAGGWLPLSSCVAGAAANYVGVLVPTLGGQQHGVVQIAWGARPPVTPPRDLAAGVSLTATCVALAASDDDATNNEATFTTKTPGFDLVSSVVGSVEGASPGTVPFATVTYTATVENTGAENVCDVFFDVAGSSGITVAAPATPGALTLVDASGAIVRPRSPIDVEIAAPVALTLQRRDGGFRIGLGGSAVCLQPGVTASLSFDGTVGDVANDSDVSVSCVVGEGDLGDEEVLDNNSATSTVTVFRADVVLAKTGVACRGGACVPGDVDFVGVGDTVDYTFAWANEGGAAAEDVVIEDILPAGTCYRVGSLEAKLPPRTVARYSDDGLDFSYAPIADARGLDCNVVGLQIVWEAPLPAGVNLDAFITTADYATGTTTGGTISRNDALLADTGSVDISAEHNLNVPGVVAGDPALVVDELGAAHVTWAQTNGPSSHVLYHSEATGPVDCGAAVNTLRPIGKPQIVMGRELRCGVGVPSKLCPGEAFEIEAATVALYEFNGSLRDSGPGGRDLVDLGGATFRPSFYNRGLWSHGPDRSDAAPMLGLGAGAVGSGLSHPFSVEFLVNVGRTGGRSRLAGVTPGADGADGWFIRDGVFEFVGAASLPPVPPVLEEGGLQTIAMVSVDNTRMEVFINGVSAGVGPIGMPLPSANLVFFPGGGAFEGIVEGLRIVARTLGVEELQRSLGLARSAVDEFSVLFESSGRLTETPPPQRPFVLWQAEAPAVGGADEAPTHLFLCAPTIAGAGQPIAWELTQVGGYDAAGTIHGEPALFVDVLGRPHVTWGSVASTSTLVDVGGQLLPLATADMGIAMAGTYPRRLAVKEPRAHRATFRVEAGGIGPFGPLLAGRMKLEAGEGQPAFPAVHPIIWRPFHRGFVADGHQKIQREIGLARLPGDVVDGPWIGRGEGAFTDELLLQVTWVADRSRDGEGTDVLGLAEDPKGTLSLQDGTSAAGVLSAPGAGDVQLGLSSLRPDPASGRLAPAWVERDRNGTDSVYIAGGRVFPTGRGRTEALTTPVASTLIGDGVRNPLMVAATWGGRIDGIERVSVGFAIDSLTAVSTFGLTAIDDATTDLGRGEIHHPPTITESAPPAFSRSKFSAVAVAWAQALEPGGQPVVAIANDVADNFFTNAPAPPFFSLAETPAVSTLALARLGPTCTDRDACFTSRAGATAVWTEQRASGEVVRILPTQSVNGAFIVGTQRPIIEARVVTHAGTGVVEGLITRSSLSGLATNVAWQGGVAPAGDSVFVIDSFPDAGTWTSPTIGPERGTVASWGRATITGGRLRDRSDACRRVLCLDGFVCEGQPDGTPLCVEAIDPTIDVLDADSGTVLLAGAVVDIDEREPQVSLAGVLASLHPRIRLRVNLPVGVGIDDIVVSYVSDTRDEAGFQLVYAGEDVTSTGSLENTGTISTSTPEIDDDNNSSTTDLDVLQADVGVVLSSSSTAALPGDTVATTAQACNSGPHAADDVVIVLEAPDATAPVDVGPCDASAYPLLSCALGTVPPWACETVSVTSVIDSGESTGVPLVWSATTTATTFDPIPGNNDGSVVVWLDQLANVVATIAGPIQTTPGEVFDLSVDYANSGNAPAGAVRVLTTPDLAKVDFVSASQVAGATPLSCRLSAGVVLCDGGGSAVVLPAGETGQLVVRVRARGTLTTGDAITTTTSIKTNSRQTNVWDDDALVTTPVGDTGRADLLGRCFFDDDGDGVFDVGESPRAGPGIAVAGLASTGTIIGPSPTTDPVAYGALITGLLPRLIGAGVAPAGTSVAAVATLPAYAILAPARCGVGGAWGFTGLPPGLYDVVKTQPPGFLAASSNGGQSGAVVDDSPVATPGHGLGTVELGAAGSADAIRGIELVANGVSAGNDFGDRGGRLAGLVWLDRDRDGVIDTGEPGLPGVTVTVFVDGNGDGAASAGDSAVAIVGTGAGGLWAVDRLPVDDGDGTVAYVAVAGLAPTFASAFSATAPNPAVRPATLRPTTLAVSGLDFGAFQIDYGDADGDGLTDADDGDCDGDGIPDVVEGFGDDPSADTNGNGVPDWTDPTIPGWTDDNGDFVNDAWDTDGDGVPDIKDLDSDNDGIPDAWEAWGPDVDADGDGIVDDTTDADGDGLWAPTDADDTDPDNTDVEDLTDTDGDGVNDWVDLDADGDGLSDIDEAGGVDADYDGVVDGDDGNDNGWSAPADPAEPGGVLWPVPDTDADGAHDWQDDDADGDGIGDEVEAWDPGGDGVPDVTPSGDDDDGDGWDDAWDPNPCCGPSEPPFIDTDSDGAPNWLDDDDNGDGVPTDEQVGPDGDGDGWADPLDDNGNDVPDHLEAGDGDEDDDGLPDALECEGVPGYGADPDNDSDADGTPDWQDPDTSGWVDNNGDDTDDRLDPDGDGVPNHLDLDSDGDGIADLWEAGGLDLDADHDGVADDTTDADNDGLVDVCDGDPTSALTPVSSLPLSDSDGDGIGDWLSLEADGDGHLDVDEAWDVDGNASADVAASGVDANGNGWDATWDPGEGATFDPGWLPDTDGDTVRDWQDPDDDGDTVPSGAEGTGDTDGDGVPDWLDTDDDDDGLPTGTEVAAGGPADFDNDGIPNWYDADADNDGLADGVDGTADVDGDGSPNWLDTDSDGDGFPDADEGLDDDDADGIADYIDPAGLPNVIDLEITATTPESFTVGEPGAYVIHVRNVGAKATISSIIVVDVLPTGQRLTGSSGEGWTCVVERGQKVVCEHEGPCAGGAALPDLTLDVSVAQEAVPEVTHTADVLTDLDAHRENNTSPPAVIPVNAPGFDFDGDGDGIPDRLDPDRDNDGIPNDDDNCPTIANAGQDDLDDDGIGDACDLRLDANFEVAGGGGVNCAQTSGDGAPLWLAFLGVFSLTAWRRRRRATTRGAAALTVAAALLPTVAQAQIQETGTIPAEQFTPAMDREGIIDVEWGTTGQHLDWDVALQAGYALNPLVLYQRKASGLENAGALVEHLVNTQVTGAITLFDWVEIGAGLPVTMFQSRNEAAISPALQTKAIASLGLGDLRLLAKFRILRADDKTPIDLAIVTPVTLPTNTPSGSYLGDLTPTFSPTVAISRALPAGVRLAGNVGYRLRGESEQPDLNLTVGQELFYKAGAAWQLHQSFDIPVQLSASVRGSTRLLAPFSQINQSPLEAIGGVTVDVGDDFQVFGDVGTGIVAGFGVPNLRAIVGLRVSPREYDRDGDGLLDRVDGCPDDPEDKDQFEDSDGCPDPDNDRDGLLDVDDQCPLAPEDRDAFKDEDGCPDPDNDADGLLDVNDACPNEPEDFDSWIDDDGCPDPDNDGDGILDVNDKCPIVPGLPAYEGCPPPDRDKDGIIDAEDRCVDVPGIAAFAGCADRDKDGIPDPDDKCPDEPETINGFQDSDGCPDKGKSKVVLTREKIEILEKVFFDFNKATIQKRSFALLDQVVAVLKANPQITLVRVEGHTDSDGVDAYNFKLSDARAASVRTYLVGKGIDPARVASAGYGETRPVADNKTAAGREKNRRVEFVIVDVSDAEGDATDVRGTKGASEAPVRPDAATGGR